MNLINRIEKLESKMAPLSTPEGLCQCINGVIVKFQKKSTGEICPGDSESADCETCRRERRKIIVEFVAAGSRTDQ